MRDPSFAFGRSGLVYLDGFAAQNMFDIGIHELPAFGVEGSVLSSPRRDGHPRVYRQVCATPPPRPESPGLQGGRRSRSVDSVKWLLPDL